MLSLLALGPVRAAGQPALPPGLAHRPAVGGGRAGGRLGGSRGAGAARRVADGGDLVPRPGRRLPARAARAGLRTAVRRGVRGTRLAVAADLEMAARLMAAAGASGTGDEARSALIRGAVGDGGGRGVPRLAGGDGSARSGAGSRQPASPAPRSEATGPMPPSPRSPPQWPATRHRTAGRPAGRSSAWPPTPRARRGRRRRARAGQVPPRRHRAARGNPPIRPSPARRLALGVTRSG